MALTPGPLASRPDATTPEQHLAQAMPTADQVLVCILTRATEIARRFIFRRGRVDLSEQASAQEPRQLPCITAVRLDALARLSWD